MTTQNASQSGDLFFEPIVNSYVSNPRFVRREWLAEEIDHRLNTDGSRFVLLTAEPGFGKSAFMAQLAADHPDWPRYFIRRDQRAPLSDVGARSFLLRIGFQLAALYPELFTTDAIRLTVEQRVGAVKEGGSVVGAEIGKILKSPFYKIVIRIQQQIEQVEGSMVGLRIAEMVVEPRLLDLADLQYMALVDPARAMQRLHPERQIVIALDALDEVRYHQSDDNVLAWLANCPDLPSNVRFILTSRPPEGAVRLFMDKQQRALQVLAIAAHDRGETAPLSGRVDKDLAAYVDKLASDAAIKTHLDALPDGAAGFKQQAMVKADGNIGYLDALARAIDQALHSQDNQTLAALLAAKYLPDDMQGLYAFFIHQIKGIVGETNVLIELPDTGVKVPVPMWSAIYEPLLAVLAVAREPVTLEQIRYLGGITAGWADLNAAKDRLLQFLDIVDRRYRLYHATLPEFLTDTRTRDNTDTEDLYVDARQWHKRIGDRYWRSHSQDWSKCDAYGLAHLPAHLDAAGAQERLRTLLFDFTWLQAKLDRLGVNALLADFALGRPTADDATRRLGRALGQGAYVLAKDKNQLAAQLLGRLSGVKDREMGRLLQGARGYRGHPWLRPLTASLAAERSTRWLRPTQGETLGSVAFSSNGRWAAHVSDSFGPTARSVVLWDLKEWQVVGPRFRTVPRYHPFALALSDDARWCLYADSSGGVYRLEAQAEPIWEGHAHRDLTIAKLLAISANGQRALSACQHGPVVAWDIEAGIHEILYDEESVNYIEALCLDSSGSSGVVARCDGSIDLVDLWPARKRTLIKLRDRPSALARSSDNAFVAAASADGRIEVRSIAAIERPVCSFSVQDQPTSIALSSDLRYVAVGTEKGKVEVWNVENGTRCAEYKGAHTYEVQRIAFSSGDDRVVSADSLQIKEWPLQSSDDGTPISDVLRAMGQVEVLADGLHAVTVLEDGRLGVWNMQTGRLEETLPRLAGPGFGDPEVGPPVGLLRATEAQRVMAWNSKLLYAWDLGTRAVVGKLAVTDTRDAAITPDGSHVVFVDELNVVRWSPDDDTRVILGTYEGDPPGHVAISPDGQRALTSGGDRQVHEWRLDDRQKPAYPKQPAHLARPRSNSWWPDARDKPSLITFTQPDEAIVMSGDGFMFALGMQEEDPQRFEGQHIGFSRLRVTDDGKFAVTSSWDRIVIWHLGMRRRIATFESHPGYIAQLSDSAQRALLTTSDGVLKIVSLRDGSLVAAFQGDKQTITCAADDELRWIVACDQGGNMHFLHFEDLT